MLKPGANPAQRLLCDAEIGSDVAKRYAFQQMRRLVYQVLVALSSGFEMCIDEPFLKADIVFLIGYSNQPFYILVNVEQFVQGRF